MAAFEELLAQLLAVGYRVFARLPRLVNELGQGRLSTWTFGNDVWREGAMCWCLVLGMAHVLTFVSLAVIRPATGVPAGKGCLEPSFVDGIVRVLNLVLTGAFNLLINSTTIACGINCDIASCTHARMTEVRTFVLSASKQVSARF